MQTFFQLTLDGKKYGRAKARIEDVAADAIDAGLAAPDRQGRIVLHEAADIVTVQAKPFYH